MYLSFLFFRFCFHFFVLFCFVFAFFHSRLRWIVSGLGHQFFILDLTISGKLKSPYSEFFHIRFSQTRGQACQCSPGFFAVLKFHKHVTSQDSVQGKENWWCWYISLQCAVFLFVLFCFVLFCFFTKHSALVIMVTCESKSLTITVLVLMVRFKMAPSINCWNLDSVSDSSKFATNAVSWVRRKHGSCCYRCLNNTYFNEDAQSLPTEDLAKVINIDTHMGHVSFERI